MIYPGRKGIKPTEPKGINIPQNNLPEPFCPDSFVAGRTGIASKKWNGKKNTPKRKFLQGKKFYA